MITIFHGGGWGHFRVSARVNFETLPILKIKIRPKKNYGPKMPKTKLK